MGATGRQVRCAACRHSWFQDPTTLDLVDRAGEAAALAAQAAVAEPPSVAAVVPPSPAISPEPPRPVAPLPVAPADSIDEGREGYDKGSDGYDVYAHAPPFRGRRNPARLWTYAAGAIAIVLLGTLGGLWWYGPERAFALLGIQAARFDTPLLIMSQVHPSQRTPSGNDLLPVSGRVINSADTAQPVPDILVEILDVRGRAIYSWTIPHPTATIAARGSVPFNSATVDPPANAVKLRFSFVGVAPK